MNCKDKQISNICNKLFPLLFRRQTEISDAVMYGVLNQTIMFGIVNLNRKTTESNIYSS